LQVFFIQKNENRLLKNVYSLLFLNKKSMKKDFNMVANAIYRGLPKFLKKGFQKFIIWLAIFLYL